MNKQLRKIVSMLLTVCLLLSVLPGEILATDGVSTAVGDGSVASDGTSVQDEGAVIAPEAALLADCQVLRYVNEEVFREKNHVSRVPGEESLSSYVFQNADGSRTVYFLDEPVKYMDSAGVIREKDLTLKSVGPDSSVEMGTLAAGGSQAVSGYATTANDIGLTLPINPSDGIRLTYGGAQITLIPQGGTQGVTAQLAEGGVNYPDFFGKGMSLRYTPLLSGVKEDIILRSYTGANTFTFLLNTGGLGLYEENGRYYVASSPDAETPIELGDLVTFDAHGRFSVGTTTAETLTPNQSYRLTLTVDEDFLTDENTTYPVTIDPSVTINKGSSAANAIQDATIYSGTPNMNANWTYLHAGYYDDTYKIARTLFRFPGLTGSSTYVFPDEFTITSVEFHIREATGSAPQGVYVHSTISDDYWAESSVTWNNASLGVGAIYATASPSYGNEAVYNITSLVRAWQNGDENPNSGLMLKSTNETSVDKAFYSTEWSTSSYRPYLVVEYVYNQGSINYDVTDVDIGSSVDLDVLGLSGPFTWTSSDTSIATVNSNGVVTGLKAGVVTITAQRTDFSPLTCTVYVTVADGTYFLTANTGKTLAVDGGLEDGDPVKLVTKNTSDVNVKVRQLWKIKYLGDGYYSIRSLYKADKCIQRTVGSTALLTVGLGDYVANFPSDALWKIESVGTGYLLQNCWTPVAKQCLKATASSTSVNTYSTGDSSFIWTLTADTSVQDMLLLIDTNTALPVTNPAKTIPYIGNSRLEDMDLLISFVSQTTNDQSGIVWETSRTWVANVSSSTGVVSPYATGSAVIKATHTSAYNTVQYTVTVAPHTTTNRFVNLDVIYDEGHTERHSDSFERIGPQLAELQRTYWDEFGIFVNYSTPNAYVSYADSCWRDIDNTCICSSWCENPQFFEDGRVVQSYYHHKNIYTIYADIDLPDTTQTFRMAYTGHNALCEADDGCCNSTSLYGLALQILGTALVRDTLDINLSTGITIHEFGHLYGAVDHYGGDWDTTEQMNNKVEGDPYSSECIYGENPYKDGKIVICEGCWNTIYNNRSLYNHNEEG